MKSAAIQKLHHEAIEVRQDGSGRVQARRNDGKPLTAEDRAAARALVTEQPAEPRAWVIDEVRDQAGNLRAKLICSAFLEDHFWLIIDPDVIPDLCPDVADDGRVHYDVAELRILKKKSPAEIKAAHQAKVKTRLIGGKLSA